MTTENNKGGKFLQQKREEKGLTRIGMAMVASWNPEAPSKTYRIDEQTLSRIETGAVSDPKFSDVVVYSQILGIPFEEIARQYGLLIDERGR